jgi:hypothetical protein
MIGFMGGATRAQKRAKGSVEELGAHNATLFDQALRAELRRLFPDEHAGVYNLLDGTKGILLQRGQLEDERRHVAVLVNFVEADEVSIGDITGFLNELPGPMRVILVSNKPLSKAAEERIASQMYELDKGTYVLWRGGVDNGALAEAVNRLLSPRQATS